MKIITYKNIIILPVIIFALILFSIFIISNYQFQENGSFIRMLSYILPFPVMIYFGYTLKKRWFFGYLYYGMFTGLVIIVSEIVANGFINNHFDWGLKKEFFSIMFLSVLEVVVGGYIGNFYREQVEEAKIKNISVMDLLIEKLSKAKKIIALIIAIATLIYGIFK